MEPVEKVFIKVVAPAFSGSASCAADCAVEVCGAPIAGMLRAMGLTVDVYDENRWTRWASDLADGAGAARKVRRHLAGVL